MYNIRKAQISESDEYKFKENHFVNFRPIHPFHT